MMSLFDVNAKTNSVSCKSLTKPLASDSSIGTLKNAEK